MPFFNFILNESGFIVSLLFLKILISNSLLSLGFSVRMFNFDLLNSLIFSTLLHEASEAQLF